MQLHFLACNDTGKRLSAKMQGSCKLHNHANLVLQIIDDKWCQLVSYMFLSCNNREYFVQE